MSAPEHLAPSPQLLGRVYNDNVRDHQIAGHVDGITQEVAADLGFSSWEDTRRLQEEATKELAPNRQLSIAEKNANERRAIAEHLGRVTKQVIDSSYN